MSALSLAERLTGLSPSTPGRSKSAVPLANRLLCCAASDNLCNSKTCRPTGSVAGSCHPAQPAAAAYAPTVSCTGLHHCCMHPGAIAKHAACGCCLYLHVQGPTLIKLQCVVLIIICCCFLCFFCYFSGLFVLLNLFLYLTAGIDIAITALSPLTSAARSVQVLLLVLTAAAAALSALRLFHIVPIETNAHAHTVRSAGTLASYHKQQPSRCSWPLRPMAPCMTAAGLGCCLAFELIQCTSSVQCNMNSTWAIILGP